MKNFQSIKISSMISMALLSSKTALAYDAIKCQWELPSYRQLCEIEEGKRDFSFKTAKEADYFGYRMDLKETLLNGSISLLTEEGKATFELTGVQPYLEVETNLVNLGDCRLNPLWQHRLGIKLLDKNGTAVSFSDVPVGHKSHRMILDTSSYALSEDGLSLQFVGSFQFVNLDKGPTAIVKRIPPECKLEVLSQRVSFDALAISSSLNSLKFSFASLKKNLLKEKMLNALYLDQARGAVCAIERLAETLYGIEGLRRDEEADLLSIFSKDAITEAIQLAVSYGAIRPDLLPKTSEGRPDYFSYYLDSENRKFMSQACLAIPFDGLKVRKENFLKDGVILNEQAYRNAEDYTMDIENAHSLLHGAWTLVTLSEVDVKGSKELSWIIDPTIYSYISEE